MHASLAQEFHFLTIQKRRVTMVSKRERKECDEGYEEDENGSCVDILIAPFLQEQQSSAPPSARALVTFLRGSNGPKTKVGLLNGKRHDYFKGTGAVKAILSPAYKKAADSKKSQLPTVASEEDAIRVLHGVIPYAFFLRVDRGDVSSKEGKPLQVNQVQMFKPDLVSQGPE